MCARARFSRNARCARGIPVQGKRGESGMKVRKRLLGRVGAAIGLPPAGGEGKTPRVSREGRRSAPPDAEIIGSPASGYHSEGGQFYTWEPERTEVVLWVAELAPWD